MSKPVEVYLVATDDAWEKITSRGNPLWNRLDYPLQCRQEDLELVLNLGVYRRATPDEIVHIESMRAITRYNPPQVTPRKPLPDCHACQGTVKDGHMQHEEGCSALAALLIAVRRLPLMVQSK